METMADDDLIRSRRDELSERRERVIRQVLTRIASAPAPVTDARLPGILDGIVSWTTPALAAAALIVAASTYALVKSTPDEGGPARVTDALGLTPRMARFVATGDVDAWSWFTEARSRP
jgi:hypothetical protein